MSIFLPTLLPLNADEKAWSLYEDDDLTPDGKSIVRKQSVRVVRDGKLVEFTTSLGPSLAFSTEPFYIPSYNMNTVGQVLEYASLLRRDGTGLQKAMDDHKEEQPLLQQYVDEREMVQRFIRENPVTVRGIMETKKRKNAK